MTQKLPEDENMPGEAHQEAPVELDQLEPPAAPEDEGTTEIAGPEALDGELDQLTEVRPEASLADAGDTDIAPAAIEEGEENTPEPKLETIADADGPEQPEESLLLSGESVDETYTPAEPDPAAASAATDADEPLELVQQLEYVPPSGKDKKGQEDDGPELTFSSIADARAVLEGFLFTSNEPLSVQRLSKLMSNLHPRTVRGLVLELQIEYDQRGGALQIVEIAGGFQMATRPHLADWMFRMHRHKRRSALSPATLETLAIVAYKQPITKGEVEAIRGVESSGTVRTLQDLNLIEASGRREVVGRPQLFVTTDQFLKSFGLRSLADLPSIAELRTLFAADQKLKAATAKKPAPEAEAVAQATQSETAASDSPAALEQGSPTVEADDELTDELLAETDELQELDQADEEDEDLEAEDSEEEEDGDSEGGDQLDGEDLEDLEDEDSDDDSYDEDEPNP